MNYQEWVSWLENRSLMPVIKPGLENTRTALRESGLMSLITPEKVIHIAGTNGKGTTAKTLEQLLLSQNKSVGLYTSPHLMDTRERLRVNGENISEEVFCDLCETYRPWIERYNLSHFESLTLFAVDFFFKHSRVDYALFEIGLGGTWDATNAIPHATSVITSIGFDHMHILGNSIEEIADNKFGIIHKNNRVLHLPYPQNLQSRLSEKIKSESAQEIAVPFPEFSIDTESALPLYVLHTPLGSVPLSLMGKRAAENMWLALNVFEVLGFGIRTGLKILSKVQWPARMTLLKTPLEAPVYLSGDHNIQGVESLLEILENCKYENIYLILGLSKNRVHEEFIEKLTRVPRSTLLLTAPRFHGVKPTTEKFPFYETPQLALDSLKEKARKEDLVVVTGSLYLCGDLMISASAQR